MAVSVLMVCLGNICRSPLAEGALRRHAQRMALDVEIDSAGTGDWHIGHAPDKRAQQVALRLGGIDIGRSRARQIRRDDFGRFDHIVAMDARNLRDLKALTPAETTAKLSLLLDHLPGHEGRSVPDPYYGNTSDFEHAWSLVDCATKAFAESVLA